MQHHQAVGEVDRDQFHRAGEWDSEPDREQWNDPDSGLPCLVVRCPVGVLCGYVGLRRDHRAFGLDAEDLDFALQAKKKRPHGGLTWGGRSSVRIAAAFEPGEDPDIWWYGFDCGHATDDLPIVGTSTGKYRNFSWVKAEVSKLALVLRDYGA